MVYPLIALDDHLHAKYYISPLSTHSLKILTLSEKLKNFPTNILRSTYETFEFSAILMIFLMILVILIFFIKSHSILWKISMRRRVFNRSLSDLFQDFVIFHYKGHKISPRFGLLVFSMFYFFVLTLYSCNATTKLFETITPTYVETIDDIMSNNCSLMVVEDDSFLDILINSPIERERRFAERYKKDFKYYQLDNGKGDSYDIKNIKKRMKEAIDGKQAVIGFDNVLNAISLIRCKVISSFPEYEEMTVYITKTSFMSYYESFFTGFKEPYKKNKEYRIKR